MRLNVKVKRLKYQTRFVEKQRLVYIPVDLWILQCFHYRKSCVFFSPITDTSSKAYIYANFTCKYLFSLLIASCLR